MIYSFFPDEPVVASTPRKIEKRNSWIAPEHHKMVRDLRRDFPRDSRGLPLRGSRRDVMVLDNRPAILVPARPTRRPF